VPKPTAAQFGAAVRLLRNSRKWSIEHLAGEAGVHWTTVSRIENGKQKPKWDTIASLAAALGVELADVTRLAAKQPLRDPDEPSSEPPGEESR
jgi:transcriptional regulator with XRE-family HTH domain